MLISLPIQLTKPKSDHAEISLFGPGIGECLVIHYGDEKWFIIDSCRCPDTKEPIALHYLKSIGVDIKTQVHGILITHWHSDHIDGAFELIKECTNAKIYYSNALTKEKAFKLAALYKKDSFSNSDKEIREFSNIIRYLIDSKNYARLKPVMERHAFFNITDDIQTTMIALSPSSTAVNQALANLVEVTPKSNTTRTRNIVPIGENFNAVAIHFTFGDFSTILGADLEDNGNPLTGWSAVFQSDIIIDLSLARSSLFKVSHHGSATGHHEQIWTELLINNPVSITTPFSPSGLPTNDRINQITDRSSEFLITREPKNGKKTKRDRMIDKELNSLALKRKYLNDKMGHIQIRSTKTGDLTISTTDNCAVYN